MNKFVEIDNNAQDFYRENGFIVLSGSDWLVNKLEEVEKEIQALFDTLLKKGIDIYSHTMQDVDSISQPTIYDRLKYLPSLAGLEGDAKILNLLKMLGFSFPILMGCSNMRYDRPENQKHLFKWHQDSVYLLGSLNAVTIWIPFKDASSDFGTISVIPGSHINGIRRFEVISDKALDSGLPFLQRDIELSENVDEDEEMIVEASRGDLVVFNQFLLHRSIYNPSDRVRWSMQLRFSDLNCENYKKNKFANGDCKNIFQVEYPGFKYEKE